MKKSVSRKVTKALYNDMTNAELKAMNIDELRMFWGTLHHWQELTMKRIEELDWEEKQWQEETDRITLEKDLNFP